MADSLAQMTTTRAVTRAPHVMAEYWPDTDELINLVKARKGPAHAPKHIKFVQELPMTGVGKVDKNVLKASFWVGRDRMIGQVIPAIDRAGRAIGPDDTA